MVMREEERQLEMALTGLDTDSFSEDKPSPKSTMKIKSIMINDDHVSLSHPHRQKASAKMLATVPIAPEIPMPTI